MATGGEVVLRLALLMLMMPLATTPLLAAAQPMFTVSAARRVRYTRRDRAAVLLLYFIRSTEMYPGLMTGILEGYTLAMDNVRDCSRRCRQHETNMLAVPRAACCVLDTELLRV